MTSPPDETPSAQDRLTEHVAALRAYVRLRLGRALRAREESEDIAQSVVREALEDLPRFEGGSKGMRAWLLKRAENKIRDRGRFWKRDRRDGSREEGIAQDEERTLLDAYRSFVTPSRAASAREELALVERAFAELPEDHRRVILLSRVGGLSHAEVARELDRSEAATRTLLSRAMARLAVLLDPGSGESRAP
jgi:RNA polymerase sigma factor (sigma-70 family)